MRNMHETTKKRIVKIFGVGCAAATLLFMTISAFAQNYEGDARKIGMGASGESDNLASKAIEEGQTDRSFVLPLGLIQLAQDRRYFDPRKDSFDPATLLEDLANPLHYTFHRGTHSTLVRDLVNGTVNPDLNTYRGFVPAGRISAQGLAAPRFGHAFRVAGDRDGTLHSLYLGAGPYLSMGTAFKIDDGLLNVLAGQTSSLPNTSLSISNTTTGQGAASFTVGYRAQFVRKNQAQGLGGKKIYVASDYHYIHGLRYDTADMKFKFDTDASGLLTDNSTGDAAVVDHFYSSSGRGHAVDVAAGATSSHWQVAVAANGIGNRIEWTGVRAERLLLDSLLHGGSYVKQPLPTAASNVTIRLPVRYNGSIAYAFDRMSGTAEFTRGFQGSAFHGGFEVRLPRVQLRGGGRYSLNQWHPTAGLGLNLTRRISLDIAGFQTTANIERARKIAVAASIRIARKPNG
jgi:hypothetical protein